MIPRVAIIYLCHGNLRHLPEVVSSMAKLEYPKEKMTVFMVPNGSPDGIADAIRKDVLPRSKQDLPEIILIDDGINHGFAAGNNLAARWALERKFDYIFLHNGDLKLHPKAIVAAVDLAESDPTIGSVQSLVLFWNNPQKVNTSGGMFHVGGYGYARDNGKHRAGIRVVNGEEIMYASGAAVLYRASALERVGLLEEGFFMYHEDLELGLRLRFAGYKNVLCTESITEHDYSFSRNPKKFEWMELYRNVVLLSYLKLRTLFVLAPLLVAIDLGGWFLSLLGGWFGAKLRAELALTTPENLKLILRMRRRAQRLRVIKDKDWLQLVVGRIEDQEQSSPMMDHINPIIDVIWKKLRRVILW